MDASLRGFLVIFDLAQIVNLVWISFKTQYVPLNTFSPVYLSSLVLLAYLDALLEIIENTRNHQSFNTRFISPYFLHHRSCWLSDLIPISSSNIVSHVSLCPLQNSKRAS
jgi:hypothetical protein